MTSLLHYRLMWNEASPDDLPPSYTAVRQNSISYSGTDASAAFPPAPAPAPAPAPTPSSVPAVDPSGFVNVWTGIIGLIADSLQTGNDIIDLNLAPDGATAPLESARTATASFKLTIQLFYKYLRHIEQGRLARPARAALVELDVVITLLTGAIVALAGLGALLQSMADVPPPSEASASDDDTRRSHVETLCANHAPLIRDFCRRILVLEKLMSKTLSALRVGDEPEALQNKVQVKEQVLNLLETNISLSDRVQRAQDSFGVPGLNDQDAGFTFTGLTLASVDSLSLIPLPVSSLELANGRFYEPEYCRAVQSQLDALVEANVKEKNRPLARILGLREPPSKLEDDRVGRRMTSIFGSRSKK